MRLAALALAASLLCCSPGELPLGPAGVGQSRDDEDAGDDLRTACDGGTAYRARWPASARLGEFVVTIATDGSFSIRRGELDVVATSPTRSWLTAGKARLTAEEHQGSFAIDEGISSACSATTPTGVRISERAVVLEGVLSGVGACDGARFVLELCAADERLDFEVATRPALDYVSLRFPLAQGEKLFGAGEQFPRGGLDLRDRVLPILAQEGGVGRGKPVVSPLVDLFSPGSAGHEGSTYYAAPILTSSRGRAVVLDGAAYRTFDLRDDLMTLRSHASRVRGALFAAQHPLDLVTAVTAKIGRMQGLPDWVHGGAIVALADDLASSAKRLDTLLGAGAKVSAVWNQTWSGRATTWVGEQVVWNWTPSAEWGAYRDSMRARGLRLICYVNPMLRPLEGPLARDLYSEADNAGYLVKNAAGETYNLPITAFEVGLVDLSNMDASAWYRDVIVSELLDAGGCDGWMADFGEALPFDAQVAAGGDPASAHNAYTVAWMELSRDAIADAGREGDILVFNRSGHTSTPAVSMLLWTGDQLTTWDDYDGLRSALAALIGGGFSGIALNHSDTGGYTSLSLWGAVGYERSARLLARWTEMNAFTAVLRTHEGNQPSVNAQVYGDLESARRFARMTRVYAALGTYRRELVEEAATLGWPVVRHLAMHFPDDADAWEVSDQFMLGSDLLVAPVIEDCEPCLRTVYLPRESWVHLWTGDRYDGPGSVRVTAPLGSPPVFFRAGSPAGERLVADLVAQRILHAAP